MSQVITLPSQLPSAKSASPEPLLGASRKQVLVADDDLSIGTLCAVMLTRAGFAVTRAEDGEQAWETLRCEQFHLVITDYNMPRISGLELARRMRSAGMMQPVILISGTPNVEKLVSDSGTPIDAILIKPFSFYELMNRINAVLDSIQPTTLEQPTFKNEQR